jgi:uncharacterized protein with FMN-binding domain
MIPPSAEDRGDERRATRDAAGGRARLDRNLVALATAGVLIVYAAGYARTESAARLLEGDQAGRPESGAPSATQALQSGEGAGAFDPGPENATVTPPAAPSQSPPAVTEPGENTLAHGPARFNDGLYTGWGTSPHGRIEASVEIRAGRIVSARISTCKTRWPCARIALLVPQVAERQSQEVDVITGATDSSDAFYYALFDALSKAQ